jgi:hypothetical protein
MHGNFLIFSRGGWGRGYRGPQRLYPVSPFLFPQYSALDLNARFLPDDNELPAHGLTAQVLVFDFGFSTPALAVGPMDAQPIPYTLGGNFLATAITGVSDVPPGANPPALGNLSGQQVDPAYLINFQQTHNGNTWQWSNKPVSNREACGTGENPLLFKSPVLIPAGDTLSCTVQNMANATLRVQIMLMGATF